MILSPKEQRRRPRLAQAREFRELAFVWNLIVLNESLPGNVLELRIVISPGALFLDSHGHVLTVFVIRYDVDLNVVIDV